MSTTYQKIQKKDLELKLKLIPLVKMKNRKLKLKWQLEQFCIIRSWNMRNSIRPLSAKRVRNTRYLTRYKRHTPLILLTIRLNRIFRCKNIPWKYKRRMLSWHFQSSSVFSHIDLRRKRTLGLNQRTIIRRESCQSQKRHYMKVRYIDLNQVIRKILHQGGYSLLT